MLRNAHMRRKHAEEEEKEKEIVVYDLKNVNSGVDLIKRL
jgi:hypothetical protein